MFLATIPAVIWVDKVGRKPVLISGAFIMAGCHIIVAILTGLFHNSWDSHVAAGWVACVFVWIFAMAFGYSWGPCSWILVAEIWPLSVRGKGVSIAASSNWMNNFIGENLLQGVWRCKRHLTCFAQLAKSRLPCSPTSALGPSCSLEYVSTL